MSVERYRRKPERTDREDQYAARYEPGQPLVSGQVHVVPGLTRVIVMVLR